MGGWSIVSHCSLSIGSLHIHGASPCLQLRRAECGLPLSGVLRWTWEDIKLQLLIYANVWFGEINSWSVCMSVILNKLNVRVLTIYWGFKSCLVKKHSSDFVSLIPTDLFRQTEWWDWRSWICWWSVLPCLWQIVKNWESVSAYGWGFGVGYWVLTFKMHFKGFLTS